MTPAPCHGCCSASSSERSLTHLCSCWGCPVGETESLESGKRRSRFRAALLRPPATSRTLCRNECERRRACASSSCATLSSLWLPGQTDVCRIRPYTGSTSFCTSIRTSSTTAWGQYSSWMKRKGQLQVWWTDLTLFSRCFVCHEICSVKCWLYQSSKLCWLHLFASSHHCHCLNWSCPARYDFHRRFPPISSRTQLLHHMLSSSCLTCANDAVCHRASFYVSSVSERFHGNLSFISGRKIGMRIAVPSIDFYGAVQVAVYGVCCCYRRMSSTLPSCLGGGRCHCGWCLGCHRRHLH